MYKIGEIIKSQDEFFKLGRTRDIDFRISSLIKLKNGICRYEDAIFDALKRDLGKSKAESYMTEIGFVLDEINFVIKNLRKWSKPKRVKTSISQIPGKSYIYREPYGKVLIMSPWNYPFQLSIAPLIGAIAGGNCAVIKPSEYSTYTSSLLKSLIEEVFESEYVKVIEGGREINQRILKEKFDYIFFTGSVEVGKIVMQAASSSLTPLTLELGGKSPCIVDRECNISTAAKKIAWGKFINSGQTCVAPDYLVIHKDVKSKFIECFKENIKKFYGDNPIKSSDYSKIINIKHFERLESYLNTGNILVGGELDVKNRKISPTLIDNISMEDNIMKEEIFGPILPIIEYEDVNEAISFIIEMPKPLALYLFTDNKSIEKKILNEVSFGGGCVNDTIIHLASSHMPFGGVGNSGIGSYHGKFSYDTFTHSKSILKKYNFFDTNLRYPPYKGKLEKIKKILK
ncbi:aldehyde dehydrogenase [Clostridium cylindrosporum]|uniref:Aldehyde dehydrogenase n=1 Tax=Clostridium cylindrosporum DSM 605 TaxID=1121307 RepID=A0A0J8DA03_CLOCY|nr:aldehyde dehydrogenase [Clostridium cylindrosporum]KMT21144.1 putative aldehyde dehydrogenase YwdH [Clostridium cylindrosporum DSM 605]